MIADVFSDEKKREEKSERARVRSSVTHERKKKMYMKRFHKGAVRENCYSLRVYNINVRSNNVSSSTNGPTDCETVVKALRDTANVSEK